MMKYNRKSFEFTKIIMNIFFKSIIAVEWNGRHHRMNNTKTNRNNEIK